MNFLYILEITNALVIERHSHVFVQIAQKLHQLHVFFSTKEQGHSLAFIPLFTPAEYAHWTIIPTKYHTFTLS